MILTQQLQEAQDGLHDEHRRAHLVALSALAHLVAPAQAGAQRIAGWGARHREGSYAACGGGLVRLGLPEGTGPSLSPCVPALGPPACASHPAPTLTLGPPTWGQHPHPVPP